MLYNLCDHLWRCNHCWRAAQRLPHQRHRNAKFKKFHEDIYVQKKFYSHVTSGWCRKRSGKISRCRCCYARIPSSSSLFIIVSIFYKHNACTRSEMLTFLKGFTCCLPFVQLLVQVSRTGIWFHVSRVSMQLFHLPIHWVTVLTSESPVHSSLVVGSRRSTALVILVLSFPTPRIRLACGACLFI